MKKNLGVGLGLAVTLVIVISLLKPALQTAAHVSPQNVALVRAIGLAKACRVYALDHDRRSPAKLSDLIEDGIVDEPEQWEEFRYLDSTTSQRMDWLYFPIADFDKAAADDLLIASPIPDKRGTYIVVFADGAGRVVKTEAFYEILRKVKR